MKLKCGKVDFTDYDFIRLFFATLIAHNVNSFDRYKLCYDLYPFKNMEEYKDLFQDIAVKHQIEGDFLLLESAIQNATAFGLISNCSDVRLIFFNPEESLSIINKYGNDYSSKMDSMVGEYLLSKKDNKEKQKRFVK